MFCLGFLSQALHYVPTLSPNEPRQTPHALVPARLLAPGGPEFRASGGHRRHSMEDHDFHAAVDRRSGGLGVAGRRSGNPGQPSETIGDHYDAVRITDGTGLDQSALEQGG